MTATSTPLAPMIGDYAIIGDCRSAALVSRWGCIDWLCWPRFDSPASFAALLDRERGGFFSIRPVDDATITRRYLPATNVLETTFRTASGVLRLTDLMPVATDAEKKIGLQPQHEILRRLECLEGSVQVEMHCDPRPAYGAVVPRLSRRGKLGVWYEHDGHALVLRSDLPTHLSGDHADLAVRCTLNAGDRRYASLVAAFGEPAVIPMLGSEAELRILRTVEWWKRWSARCQYQGKYPDAVLRSALTLKLMEYAPSGAVIAAPTTSLPEKPGGVRNWDYRYCWLRDSSFTLQALFDLGYRDEGEAFLSWLLHTTSMTLPELQLLYDVYGETRLHERTLPHLAGFANSRPVRIGNGAANQLQLDVYGEVVDAVYEFTIRGGRLDRGTRKMLRGFGETVCRRWVEPDEGIWEPRGGRRHNTYSKAMCWVALERICRMADDGLLRAPVAKFRAAQKDIRDALDTQAFNTELGCYTSILNGHDVDASLLLLSRYGYLDATDPRMRATYQHIVDRLSTNGLLYRYHDDDGLPGGEGAFGICSFWAVTCLAEAGERERAMDAFEHVLSFSNDVGLFAEEIDPRTGAALGNFPQAFTHVGLIDAALEIAKVRGTHQRPTPIHPMTLTEIAL